MRFASGFLRFKSENFSSLDCLKRFIISSKLAGSLFLGVQVYVESMLGFVGALAVIVLFALLLWRGYRIASRAPDKFTSLVAYGLTTKIALQAAMNIAVVTNSMPNTGISLPFFSSGGTALMIQIFEMGIILSISRFSSVKK